MGTRQNYGTEIMMMNRRIALVAVCLFWCIGSAQAYSGGSGTAADPYQIATAEDLIALGSEPNDYDKHFILTADIDLSAHTFNQAVVAPDTESGWGFKGVAFAGVFDGNGHVVCDLRIRGDEYLGLFGCLADVAMVNNLGLESIWVEGGKDHVGSLTGCSEGTVANCRSAGTVVGHDHVGGLVGCNRGGTVSNCRSAGTVVAGSNVGGLVGYNDDGSIFNSNSAAESTGNMEVGGLVGYSDGGSVLHCYSIGAVTGGYYLGGLIGRNDGSISNSYSMGDVTGKGTIGGLVGYNCNGNVSNCYSTGVVVGDGLYAGGWSIGGLVGTNYDGNLSNCYSTGAVVGDTYVGGLLGYNDIYGVVWHCYSTGTVTGNSHLGGLVGYNYRGYTPIGFWDTETSGLAISDGGEGLTTAGMQDIAVYLDAGWDFVGERANGTAETWLMSQAGGYPRLNVFEGDEFVVPQGQGTLAEPFLITNVQELCSVGHRPLASYRLDTDIDLSQTSWSAAVVPWFAGHFDGNGHVIRHLRIQGGDSAGLFGFLAIDSVVIDLGLEDCIVQTAGRGIASLAAVSAGSVMNCRSTGAVTGSGGPAGGLIGDNRGGSISDSHSTCSITGGVPLGGLVGENSGDVSNCYSTGAVTGGYWVGGLVGYNFLDASISHCHSTGQSTGYYATGGLVGESCGSVSHCHSTGAFRGELDVGGLVGVNRAGGVYCCYSAGTVAGLDRVGGLVGLNVQPFPVRGDTYDDGPVGVFWCYSAATITGEHAVGGLVGNNAVSISNSYSAGAVGEAWWNVGGLVGENHADVVNCYSIAEVPSREHALIGDNSGSVTQSFWDIELSGQTDDDAGQGLTTAQMQDADTYLDAGWDLVDETDNGVEDIWWIEDADYPRLWWEAVGP